MPRTICVCVEWLSAEQREHIRSVSANLGFQVEFFMPGEEEAAKECLQCAEVLLGHSPELLAAAGPQLQWYCCTFAGVDPYCSNPSLFANPNCLLTNSSGCYDETIAEHILMATFMLLRRIPAYQRITQARGWENQLPIRSIREVNICVLGAGNIGSAYASKALALGARPIIGVSRSGRARAPFSHVFAIDQLDEVLPSTDVLAMALPGTPQTAHILDARRIALLPERAVVINVGRGSAIDQQALIAALENGHLGGAALDVMTPEPLPADDPLWDAPNVFLTPHVSGNMTMGWTRTRCVELFCEDLHNFATGRPLARLVDRTLGY